MTCVTATALLAPASGLFAQESENLAPVSSSEERQARLEVTTAPNLEFDIPEVVEVPEGATQIFCDKETRFDVENRTVSFSGDVKIIDPRFQMKSENLTVYINPKGGDIDRAIAEGGVAILHLDRSEAGKDPRRSVGRADKAVYHNATGEIELTGNPQLQQGLNVHVATSPSTKMIITRSGQLRTTGPSKTLIKDTTAQP